MPRSLVVLRPRRLASASLKPPTVPHWSGRAAFWLLGALLSVSLVVRAAGVAAASQADPKPATAAKASTAAKSAPDAKGKKNRRKSVAPDAGAPGAPLKAGPAKADPAAPAPAATPVKVEPLCPGDTIDEAAGKPDPAMALIEGLIHLPADEPGTEAMVVLVNGRTGEHHVLASLSACAEKSQGGLIYRAVVAPGPVEVTLSRPRPADGRECQGTASVPDRCISDSVKLEAAAGELRRADLILGPAPRLGSANSGLLGLVPLAFLLILWTVRWNNIALPTRRALMVAVQDVKSRLLTAKFPHESGPIGELNKLIQEDTWWHRARDFFWWSRGWEIAGWRVLHQAEARLVSSFAAEETDAQLLTVQQALTEFNTPAASGMLNRIATALQPADVTLPQKRALLATAMDYISARDDTDFSTLTSWQNKASWLTMTGILLIFSLGFSAHHSELFLAGAAGGFLSRLMRQLKRADVPSDYGASWSTMFLSPVSGALGGWFGVLIVMMLSSARLGILGPMVATDWDTSNLSWLLAIAFVLGFSERLFDSLLAQAEKTIDKQKEAADTTPVVPPVPPGGGGGGNDDDDDGGNDGGGKGKKKDKDDKADKNDKTRKDTGEGAADDTPVEVKPGGTASVTLDTADSSVVQTVLLMSADSWEQAEAAVSHPVGDDGQVSFTVPSTLSAGEYALLLVDPAGKRKLSGTKLKVTAAEA